MLSALNSDRSNLFGLTMLLGLWSHTVLAQEALVMMTEKEATHIWGDVISLMEKDSHELLENQRQLTKTCPSSTLFHKNNSRGENSSAMVPSYGAHLVVFVSFSMSDQALKKLYKDVMRVGGRLAFRGLINNSFAETAKKLNSLKIVASIDPVFFDLLKVTCVPQFTIIEEKESGASGGNYSLCGNVTLDFALEKFSQNGSLTARKFLERSKKEAS